MKDRILSYLHAECPWRDTLLWFDCTDSTNVQAQALAQAGAEQGTVVLAGTQTQGRGRLDHSFFSPRGQGMYLSLILRPQCRPDQLMHLTCAVGVAARRAVHRVCGLEPGLKWINDLQWQGKKLGGILTKLSVDPHTGLVDDCIVGIGINCLQEETDFPEPLRELATSLTLATGQPVDPAKVTAAVIEELWRMSQTLLTQKKQWMADYTHACVTLGNRIQVIRGEECALGYATALDPDGGLVVDFADGHRETVNSGEVRIRNL